jgi:hypothetical protein
MKKVSVVLVDDLDGKVIDGGKGRSVGFAFDGQSYELDLSTANVDRLKAALKPFISAARKSGKSDAPVASRAKKSKAAPAPKKRATASSRPASSAAKSDVQAIRAWANANGHTVGDRGRISTTVRDAYEKATQA